MWDFTLTERAKLIEIAPISDARRNNLVLLVGGENRNDYKRRLMVTHWDGFRFAGDYTTEFLGTLQDALLAGRFRVPRAGVGPGASAPPTTKKKSSAPNGGRQVVTTEGVYEWTGSGLSRLFNGPTELKLAFTIGGSPDQLVAGAGDRAIAYEVGENDVHPSAVEPPSDGEGCTRYGLGTQEYPNDDAMNLESGARFVQSSWSGRERWLIGLVAGKPAGVPEFPKATTGDRLVVFTPKANAREKSFWSTQRSDLEESWRSDPLPGRVLDVRVGDPRNEGKEGILVLTAENNDKDRRLYFYAPSR